MKSNNKQAGFSVVEVLLVLIFLAIVGFTGYYVWHAQRSTDKTLSNTGNSQVASTSKKKATASTDGATVYLTVKEWGVKMPLTADISNAYYTQNSAVPNAVYLSLTQYKGTNCAADSTSLGAITRFTATDKDDDGNTLLSDSPSAVKIGSYYYNYEHPQAGCDGRTTNDTAGFDDAAAAKTSDLMTEFKTASTKLVAS